MAYIGREPLGGEVILMNSIESQFNGVLTTFNLTRTVSGVTSAFYPVGTEQLLVSLGGVIQQPDPTGNTGFRISSNTIIFAIAPAAGTSCFIVAYGNLTDIGAPANNTVTTDKLVDGSVTPIKLSTGGPWWLSNGNVGIGTTNPATKLDVISSAYPTAKFNSTYTSNSKQYTTLVLGVASTNAGSTLGYIYDTITPANSFLHITPYGSAEGSSFVVGTTGNVGIGTTNPTNKLHIFQGNLELTGGYNLSWGGDFSGGFPTIWGNGNDKTIRFAPNGQTNGLNALLGYNVSYILNGNVGIGTTNPEYKLEVNGSFAATTKSFVIPHPSKPNYKLRYACLEGPENSVYVRGRTKDNVIELPDYWIDLVHEESITVNLTPVGNKRIWIEEINNNKVYINSEDTIDCHYTVFAERKDVEKLVVEIEEN